MKWQFEANSPAELSKIGPALFNGPKQNALDEQVQMTRLLESLAGTQVLQYPLRVNHTGNEGVPDFELQSGEIHIAVEITKITVPDVEHARALQNKGLRSTLAISSLYRQGARARRKEQVISEGFTTPTFVFPVSVVELDQIWNDAVNAALVAKSAVISNTAFARGNQNWLLLWDRLGTEESELRSRMDILTGTLLHYWKPGWYSRVFLQNQHFFWQVMFTPKECSVLPKPPLRDLI